MIVRALYGFLFILVACAQQTVNNTLICPKVVCDCSKNVISNVNNNAMTTAQMTGDETAIVGDGVSSSPATKCSTNSLVTTNQTCQQCLANFGPNLVPCTNGNPFGGGCLSFLNQTCITAGKCSTLEVQRYISCVSCGSATFCSSSSACPQTCLTEVDVCIPSYDITVIPAGCCNCVIDTCGRACLSDSDCALPRAFCRTCGENNTCS